MRDILIAGGVLASCFMAGRMDLFPGLTGITEFVVVAGFGGLVWLGLQWLFPETPDQQPTEEFRKKLKRLIRELVEEIHPPLSGDESRSAIRKIYRAVEEKQEEVTLRFGERSFLVTIFYAPEKIRLNLDEENPCSSS